MGKRYAQKAMTLPIRAGRDNLIGVTVNRKLQVFQPFNAIIWLNNVILIPQQSDSTCRTKFLLHNSKAILFLKRLPYSAIMAANLYIHKDNQVVIKFIVINRPKRGWEEQ